MTSILHSCALIALSVGVLFIVFTNMEQSRQIISLADTSIIQSRTIQDLAKTLSATREDMRELERSLAFEVNAQNELNNALNDALRDRVMWGDAVDVFNVDGTPIITRFKEIKTEEAK